MVTDVIGLSLQTQFAVTSYQLSRAISFLVKIFIFVYLDTCRLILHIDHVIGMNTVKLNGSNYLRQRIILSTLSGKSLKITKIRETESNPGVTEEEMNLLRLVERKPFYTGSIFFPTGSIIFFKPEVSFYQPEV